MKTDAQKLTDSQLNLAYGAEKSTGFCVITAVFFRTRNKLSEKRLRVVIYRCGDRTVVRAAVNPLAWPGWSAKREMF